MRALSDLKVVEWGEFISAPYCGKLLADLGAEVIKVEDPCGGDTSRRYGPFPHDVPHHERSGLFLYLNTNKLSVTLDTHSVAGARLFKELLVTADILVENHPPAQLLQLGLDYEYLKECNRRLIVTSITPFGQTGPYRDLKGCDLTCFHLAGLAFVNPSGGVDDIDAQPPLRGPANQADFLGGLSAAVATMSAVFAVEKTGTGQHIDISQQEALASMIRRNLGDFSYEGLIKMRLKGTQPTSESVLGQCRDGAFYALCNTDRFWANWLEVMGNPDWAASELFESRGARRENWDAAKAMIEDWAKDQNLDEVVDAASEKRVPCMPVNSVKGSVNSRLFAARDYFAEVDHPQAGRVKYPGAPYKLSGTPWAVAQPAPLLGQHNEEIYCKRLGYSKEDLARMRATGVI